MLPRKMLAISRDMAEHLKKKKRKMIGKRREKMDVKNQRTSIEIVEDYDCSLDEKVHSTLFLKLASLAPLKLLNCKLPTYPNPETVEVMITQSGPEDKVSSDYISFQAEDSPQFTSMPFSVFRRYQGNLDLSVPQMKLEPRTVNLPNFVSDYFIQTRGGISKSNIQAINLWYDKAHKISTWHYDGHDNFLFIEEGKKIIHLLPPSSPKMGQQKCIAKSIFNINSNHSGTADFEEFIRGCEKVWKVEISSGECLFIPRGWWHYVQSIGSPTVAVNIWGNSLKTAVKMGEQEMMLKHLVFQMSEKICQSTSEWQSFPEQMKTKYRQAYFMLYFNKRLQNN